MLKLHPIYQAMVFLPALYALYLGFQRFRVSHLKHKTAFNWKRHVQFGWIGLTGWFLGLIGGLTMVRYAWRGFLVTGDHGIIGLVIAPLIVFGLISGYRMNKVKKKRRVLPLVHGINNLAVVILAIVQIFTGLGAARTLLMGM